MITDNIKFDTLVKIAFLQHLKSIIPTLLPTNFVAYSFFKKKTPSIVWDCKLTTRPLWISDISISWILVQIALILAIGGSNPPANNESQQSVLNLHVHLSKMNKNRTIVVVSFLHYYPHFGCFCKLESFPILGHRYMSKPV